MSTIRANYVTDAAGTGAPTFSNGIKTNAILDASGGNTATINGMVPVGTTATQTLTNKSIDAGQLTGRIASAQVNSTGSAPVYGCRAWINFNGTASTIRNSGNVSTLVKNSVGNYTINFSTAMPHANYTVVLGGNLTTGGTETRKLGGIGVLATSTSSCSIITGATHAISIEDYAEIHVMIIC